jgi:hypothetical protein
LGGERANREGKRINMVMYFVYFHENRTMKPVEIVLRSGQGDEGERFRN